MSGIKDYVKFSDTFGGEELLMLNMPYNGSEAVVLTSVDYTAATDKVCHVIRNVFCSGSAGAIAVEFADGTSATLYVAANSMLSVHPLMLAKVLKTGTDATTLIAIY